MSTTAQPETKKTVNTRVGVVESDKRTKSRKIVINWQSEHPKYGKYVSKRTVIHAHDEKNESRLGDMVEIAPCRPISKTKRWTLVRVVRKGPEQRFQTVTTPLDEVAAAAAAAAGSGGAKPAAAKSAVTKPAVTKPAAKKN